MPFAQIGDTDIHFEILGWPETHVVFRFWILSACGSAIAGAIFYADAIRAL